MIFFQAAAMKKIEEAVESFEKLVASLKKGKFVLGDKVSIDIHFNAKLRCTPQ